MTEKLKFSGDRCGHAYKFKRNSIGNYDCYCYDWKTGWYNCWEVQLTFGLSSATPRTYDEAVALCTAHAKRHGYFKYLPQTRPMTPGELLGGAIAAAAAAAGFSI